MHPKYQHKSMGDWRRVTEPDYNDPIEESQDDIKATDADARPIIGNVPGVGDIRIGDCIRIERIDPNDPWITLAFIVGFDEGDSKPYEVVYSWDADHILDDGGTRFHGCSWGHDWYDSLGVNDEGNMKMVEKVIIK